MNTEQKLSPKYWVCHDIETDDVFFGTMSKMKSTTEDLANQLLGTGWEEAEFLKIDLIELNFAEVYKND